MNKGWLFTFRSFRSEDTMHGYSRNATICTAIMDPYNYRFRTFIARKQKGIYFGIPSTWLRSTTLNDVQFVSRHGFAGKAVKDHYIHGILSQIGQHDTTMWSPLQPDDPRRPIAAIGSCYRTISSSDLDSKAAYMTEPEGPRPQRPRVVTRTPTRALRAREGQHIAGRSSIGNLCFIYVPIGR